MTEESTPRRILGEAGAVLDRMKTMLMLSVLAFGMVLGTAALAQEGGGAGGAVGATTRPGLAAGGDDVLYEDGTGQTSATITQVLGAGNNSTPQNTTVNNVKRIRIKSDVFIIEWGDTATTLLPKQFVAGIALNRRAAR